MNILMMGTGTFAEPTFQALLRSRHRVVGLVTNPDRPSGKDREMERGMKKIAVDAGVPTFQPLSINTPESIAHLQATFHPDIYVVAAYGQILSREVLTLPPKGGINVHSSLLPKYRGAAPIAWAIHQGEKETGVTIIRMTPRMDAGEMLGQVVEPIRSDDTAGSLEARLAAAGATLAMQVLEQIDAGTEQGVVQDMALVTKAPKLTKEMGLITFQRTASETDCQIRAMQPWPIPYTFYHRQQGDPLRLIVLRGIPDASATTTGTPGSVIEVTNSRCSIACGQGTVLHLEQVQPSGKKAQSIAEFLRGYRVQVGDRFGVEKLQ
jgi:methionyl-tRNA formyltransferase